MQETTTKTQQYSQAWHPSYQRKYKQDHNHLTALQLLSSALLCKASTHQSSKKLTQLILSLSNIFCTLQTYCLCWSRRMLRVNHKLSLWVTISRLHLLFSKTSTNFSFLPNQKVRWTLLYCILLSFHLCLELKPRYQERQTLIFSSNRVQG